MKLGRMREVLLCSYRGGGQAAYGKDAGSVDVHIVGLHTGENRLRI